MENGNVFYTVEFHVLVKDTLMIEVREEWHECAFLNRLEAVFMLVSYKLLDSLTDGVQLNNFISILLTCSFFVSLS